MCWGDIDYILNQCKEKTKNKKAQWLVRYMEKHIQDVFNDDDEPMCFEPSDIIKILEWLKLTM